MLLGQNTTRTKQLNKQLVLNIIRKYQPIPRYKIAKKTQLTRGTISNIVSELIEEDLITSGGAFNEDKNRVGPRSVALEINGEALQIIGVHISMNSIQIGLVNLNGELLRFQNIKIQQLITNEGLNELLINHLNSFIFEETREEKVKAIGIGVSGIVDSKKDVVIKSNHLNIDNYHIVEYLQTFFKVPIYLENNVKSMANAERMFGAGKYNSNFLSIHIGEGIGSGMIINDTLFHENSIGLGEFGHMTYLPDGIPCWCGNRGCIERYASENEILQRLNISSIKKLFDLINDKNTNVLRELDNVGRKVGIVLVSLVNMLRFSEVIFSGNLADKDLPLLNAVNETVNTSAYNSNNKRINIHQTSLGKNIGVLGAASLALESVYSMH